MALDDDTLRRLLAARTPGEWEMRPRMWEDEEYYVEVRGAPPGYLGCRYHNVGGTWEPVTDAQLWAAAPALAAEVLRLRERAERDEAERDEAEREVLHLRSELFEHAHKAGEWEESHDIELARAERVEAAARAHLAAADALTLARRTDAADVPAAEARTLAARECLAGLVGYAGEVGR